MDRVNGGNGGGSQPQQQLSAEQLAEQQKAQIQQEVTTMREEDYERLVVYIVLDVACPQGTQDRAEKTLPRSLTLKPSVVLSTPNTPVSFNFNH